MIQFIYPSVDTTIYETSGSQNTGADRILELNKIVTTTATGSSSRILMNFELENIASKYLAGAFGNAPKFFLHLKSTNKELELPSTSSLEVYLVAESWVPGLGKLADTPVTVDGASWRYRNDNTNRTAWTTASFAAGTTGSWALVEGGATWYTGSAYSASVTLNYEMTDARIDVTNIFVALLSGSRNNNGIIIKRPDSEEQSTEFLGNLQFFSRESNTIYVPKLEIAWDNSSFATGSMSPINANSSIIYFNNLQQSYYEESMPRLNISGRDRYPVRTFSTASNYAIKKYLPSGSYYAVKDAYTDEMVIPFSEYTKISCNANGNFFDFDMNGLLSERHYRFIIKISGSNGGSEYFDNDFYFKVTR
jgi:hypothetical protein